MTIRSNVRAGGTASRLFVLALLIAVTAFLVGPKQENWLGRLESLILSLGVTAFVWVVIRLSWRSLPWPVLVGMVGSTALLLIRILAKPGW